MDASAKISFNRVFFTALLILIAVNIIGSYSGDSLLLITIKAIFIPVLLIFFFIKNKSLSIPLVSFFVFSFLGDASSIYFTSDMLIKASSVFYFLSYMCLISIIISKFNIFKIDKIIGTYLVLIFFINAYFLYTLYNILKTVVTDNFEVFLFGIKSFSLITLIFLAFGAYLRNESKSSILFLMTALCLVFSAVLNYVNLYYVYNSSFLMLERGLYAFGLYLLFKYTMEENKRVTISKDYNSDSIFA